jgi:hypothetical protein
MLRRNFIVFLLVLSIMNVLLACSDGGGSGSNYGNGNDNGGSNTSIDIDSEFAPFNIAGCTITNANNRDATLNEFVQSNFIRYETAECDQDVQTKLVEYGVQLALDMGDWGQSLDAYGNNDPFPKANGRSYVSMTADQYDEVPGWMYIRISANKYFVIWGVAYLAWPL